MDMTINGLCKEAHKTAIQKGDLAGSKGIDLESIILAKMAYNKTRPYKHGGKLY